MSQLKCRYILFIVLNDMKKFKAIKKRLRQLDINRYTAIDTVGATCYLGRDFKYSSLLASSMGNLDHKQYNKTLFVALPSEEEVIRIMDELEKVLDIDVDKPGKGIMFTVPIYSSHGVRE